MKKYNFYVIMLSKIKMYLSTKTDLFSVFFFFFQKIADKFLDGEINVEDFIQTFQSQKTVHSLRKVKTEKLSELLRSRTSSQYSYRF